MSEIIVIEAVSDKFKNKYSSGSVLAGGKWMQVSSKLDIKDFAKDTEICVETKTNDKGYTSIVGIVPREKLKEGAVEIKSTDTKKNEKEGNSKVSYEDAKSRKILVQGVTQAVIQAPFLAGLPFTNSEEAVKLIKEISVALIEFVDEKSN